MTKDSDVEPDEILPESNQEQPQIFFHWRLGEEVSLAEILLVVHSEREAGKGKFGQLV